MLAATQDRSAGSQWNRGFQSAMRGFTILFAPINAQMAACTPICVARKSSAGTLTDKNVLPKQILIDERTAKSSLADALQS